MKRVSNLSLFHSAGFLPAIFDKEKKKHVGNLFIDGQMTSDTYFDGEVVVIDLEGNILPSKFDGDVFILTVTDRDFRCDCKVPGGTSNEGEDEYQTLVREISEEVHCNVRRALQFRREKYGEHSRNFFVIDTVPDLELTEIRFSYAGKEKLKISWTDIVSFSCCLFKNQRSAFKQLVKILAKNKTFSLKYPGLVEYPFVGK